MLMFDLALSAASPLLDVRQWVLGPWASGPVLYKFSFPPPKPPPHCWSRRWKLFCCGCPCLICTLEHFSLGYIYSVISTCIHALPYSHPWWFDLQRFFFILQFVMWTVDCQHKSCSIRFPLKTTGLGKVGMQVTCVVALPWCPCSTSLLHCGKGAKCFVAMSSTSIESLKRGTVWPQCVILCIHPHLPHCEVQCTEVWVCEMETIGARHAALAAVQQAFSVRIVRLSALPLESTHLSVLPRVWGLLFLCELVRGRQQQKSRDGAEWKCLLNPLGLIRREVCARPAFHVGSHSFNALGGSAVYYEVGGSWLWART